MDAGDFEIVDSDGSLTVLGEKSKATVTDGHDFRCRERIYGRFRRLYRLPPDLDTENAAATFKNGMLSISVPARPTEIPKEKKIAITTG